MQQQQSIKKNYAFNMKQSRKQNNKLSFYIKFIYTNVFSAVWFRKATMKHNINILYVLSVSTVAQKGQAKHWL